MNIVIWTMNTLTDPQAKGTEGWYKSNSDKPSTLMSLPFSTLNFRKFLEGKLHSKPTLHHTHTHTHPPPPPSLHHTHAHTHTTYLTFNLNYTYFCSLKVIR